MADAGKVGPQADIIEKWGVEVAERGFVQIPNYLLLINQFVASDDRLPPIELITLFELVGAWWKKNEAPFPSVRTLSIRAGVSDRQMQRALKSLEQKGLLKRVRKKGKGIISSNAYELSGLVETLKEAAAMYETPFKRTIKGGPGDATSSKRARPIHLKKPSSNEELVD